MAILPIYNSFHPILNKPTKKIDNINGELHELVNDMFETMYFADGIGLAANQVGIEESIITIDIAGAKTEQKHPPLVLINPVIEDFSPEDADFSEGCLSVPEFFEKVIRPEAIQVRFTDIEGNEQILETNDLLARVIQHEVDHLKGILFYQKLSPIRKTLAKNKLRKIKEGKVIPKYQMIRADGNL